MKKILLAIGFAVVGFAAQTKAQTVLSQNFEGVTVPNIPGTWTNVSTSTPGWATTNLATNMYFATVPNHSTYALVNDYGSPTGTNNSLDQLISPVFTTGTSTYMKYDYYYFGAWTNATPSDTEKAYIDISTNGGTTWTTVEHITYNTTSDWETHFVNLSAYNSQANCKLRVVYTDGGGDLIGVCVDNIQVYSSASADMAITYMTPQAGSPAAYGLVGGTVNLGANVQNLSGSTVNSYTMNYSIDGGAPVSATVNTPISAFTSTAYSTSMTIPSVGTHSVKMWVTVAGDADHTNDTAYTSVVGVSFMPTKKLCIEEATGSWCGWCVRGIVYMDSLRTLYGDNVSLIAVHDQDQMSAFSTNTSTYDSYISGMIGGYPSVVVDRRYTDDPSNLLTIYNNDHADFGFADITLSTPTISGTNVTIPVAVKPAMNLSGDYRLALVLTEDQVHGTSSAWDQHNYYSYQSQNQPLTGQGVNYQNLTNPIPAAQMYYQFVARSITPATTGGTGLLPASMTAGTTYNYTFSSVSFAGVNRHYMHAVVMLIDGSTGNILNTQNVAFDLGVNNVAAGIDNVILFPNPASSKTTIKFDLDHYSNVMVDVTDVAGRGVYATSSEMNAGSQQLVIPTNNLAAGTYNVRILTDKGFTTERLTVVK